MGDIYRGYEILYCEQDGRYHVFLDKVQKHVDDTENGCYLWIDQEKRQKRTD